MSVIQTHNVDFFHAVEQFYLKGEKRTARFFEYGPDDYVFISAPSQCDIPQ